MYMYICIYIYMYMYVYVYMYTQMFTCVLGKSRIMNELTVSLYSSFYVVRLPQGSPFAMSGLESGTESGVCSPSHCRQNNSVHGYLCLGCSQMLMRRQVISECAGGIDPSRESGMMI